MDIFDFEYVTKILEESYYTNPSPSVTLIANTKKDPFNILLSTILSLRTKDKVTLEASNRLFEKVKNFNDILDISINEIERLIYPVGFYKTKAKRIKEIAKENSVTIIENPSLARALYDQIELEREVPSEFYKAIAEIFSYVYELKKKR